MTHVISLLRRGLCLVCALVLFGLGGWCRDASATRANATVYPTGSFPLDVQNVQAAVNRGGTVILKATNSAGQPTAFNFGPPVETGSGVNLTTDVAILGERVGQYMTTINGGFTPFLGLAPAKTDIEGIDFEGPLVGPIALIRSTGADIVGNRIRGVVPLRLFFGFTEIEGIFVSGFDDPQHAITGRIRIADNLIELSGGDFANGMQFDEVSANIEVSGNTVHFLESDGVIQVVGILVFRSHGKANVVNNSVMMGPGDPGAFPVGIFAGGHAEARYLISHNTVVTNHPNSDGIDIVGLSNSGPTKRAIIEGNHVVMQSPLLSSDAMGFFGAVSNSHMVANQLEGMAGNAIDIFGLDSALIADSNHAVGNDISQLSALNGDVFFGPFSINNLVAGQCATYIDQGVGNHITCGTAINPVVAVARGSTAPSRRFNLVEVHGARMAAMRSRVSQ